MTDAWNGVPENPARDGIYWIIGWNGTPFVAEWFADPNGEFGGSWAWVEGGDHPDGVAANGWKYGGPCFTPAEAQAREAAAYQRGQEDMRERAAETARCVPIPEDAYANEAHGRLSAALHAAIAIRALPIKEARDD